MRWNERLDPEVGAVLDQVPKLNIADIPTAREERDRLAAAARRAWVPSGRVLSEDRIVPAHAGRPEVGVRVHRPSDQQGDLPVLVWIHGGGHVLGTAAQDDPLLDEVVAELHCVAVAVDWRRAPEHPYPAALEDCYAAVAWVHENAGALRLDPGRVVAAGASSGGGLAAGLALLTRDQGQYRLSGQVLIYPMLDDRAQTPSSTAVTDERIWNDRSNRLAWSAYLGSASADVPSYAAPSRAHDRSGPPPDLDSDG